MTLKETALTVVGLPTGLKRAYEAVKPLPINTESKVGLTALISPVAFAVPELVNMAVAVREEKYWTTASYAAALFLNKIAEIVTGIKVAETAVHLAEVANLDPTLSGVIGFAVGALGSRIFHNSLQNTMHEIAQGIGTSTSSSDSTEGMMIGSLNSTTFMTETLLGIATM